MLFTFGVLLSGWGCYHGAYLPCATVEARSDDPSRVNRGIDGWIDAPGVALTADVDGVGLALPYGEAIGIERSGLAFGHHRWGQWLAPTWAHVSTTGTGV
jgi:hypothetical protein